MTSAESLIDEAKRWKNTAEAYIFFGGITVAGLMLLTSGLFAAWVADNLDPGLFWRLFLLLAAGELFLIVPLWLLMPLLRHNHGTILDAIGDLNIRLDRFEGRLTDTWRLPGQATEAAADVGRHMPVDRPRDTTVGDR